MNLAGAFSMLGNYADALTSYRRAVEIEPDNAETLTRLSAFLERLGAADAGAAKRDRIAALTTVVTTFANAGAFTYDGRYPKASREVNRPHPRPPSPPAPLPKGEGRRVAFVSPHCIMDFASGAATATRDGLAVLAGQGFICEAFCGTRIDGPHQESIQESLARLRLPHAVQDSRIGPFAAQMIFTSHTRVPVTLVDLTPATSGLINREEIAAFLTGCELFLDRFRPDTVLTYGGDPVSIAVQRLAKRHGAKVVFWLHNFAYTDRAAFAAADHVVVHAEFTRRYYREKLGLNCYRLPYIVHWKEAEQRSEVGSRSSAAGFQADFVKPPCSQLPASYVTFINPQETKGVFVFARIARELALRRPAIPLLVTQGRSRRDALKDPALGLAPHLLGQLPIDPMSDGRNITTMPFTPDPRDFYPAVFARTKLLLMPSLWNESFGLVAAEAMLNGIPVLASNRGALPETIGDAGFLFDIPAHYTPQTRVVPTAEEVAPWVETIIRLWDDAAYYDQCSRAARERAQAWHPDRLAPLYRDFFSRIVRQTAPALGLQEGANK